MQKFIIILLLFLLSGDIGFASEVSRLPGTSIADALLQRDTLLPLYTVTAVKVPDCNDISVINTELISRPEYNKIKGNKKYASSPWNELWTVKACGKNVYVPITFVPNEKGTSYIIKSDSVKLDK